MRDGGIVVVGTGHGGCVAIRTAVMSVHCVVPTIVPPVGYVVRYTSHEN